jgi:hypothetical protein
MKFKAPKIGDTRHIKKFLWLPLTLRIGGTDKNETRWLCFTYIHQRWAYEWINEWFVY